MLLLLVLVLLVLLLAVEGEAGGGLSVLERRRIACCVLWTFKVAGRAQISFTSTDRFSLSSSSLCCVVWWVVFGSVKGRVALPFGDA